jgi:hypothetical protein
MFIEAAEIPTNFIILFICITSLEIQTFLSTSFVCFSLIPRHFINNKSFHLTILYNKFNIYKKHCPILTSETQIYYHDKQINLRDNKITTSTDCLGMRHLSCVPDFKHV